MTQHPDQPEPGERSDASPAGEPAPAAETPADPSAADIADDLVDAAFSDMVEEGGHLYPGQELPDEISTTPEEELATVQRELAERTADLQRLQAEFLNYKRRVDRDRSLLAENATYKVLTPIIEVLDNIDRAREHEALDDGFKAVAEQLERVVAGLGLTRFGAVGDPFDPNLHEALSHLGEDPEVTVTTCKVVPKAGYRIGDRVVRAAQVLVVDPPA